MASNNNNNNNNKDSEDQKKFYELTKDMTEEDKQNLNPDNMMVNIGGKSVPFGKINKPHAVVMDPSRHKPRIDPKDFPDLTDEAKAREAELEAKRQEKDK